MKTNISLLPYHTFGAKVNADFFTTFSNKEELKTILQQKPADQNFIILGGGSNILFTQDFHGMIIKNEIRGFEVLSENDTHVTLKIGAGENWHDTVMKTVEKGWQGIENLALIPGTVGASPIQNIGAYGVEVKDVIQSVEFYHFEKDETFEYSNQDCQFGYRNSVFKNELKGKIAVLSITVKLNKEWNFNTSYGAIEDEIRAQEITHLTPLDLAKVIIKIRESKLPDPKEIGNCGSFFKNPVLPKSEALKIIEKYPEAPHYIVSDEFIKIPAGWLIQTAGWKGKSLGNVGTYPKQALVLVNNGGATGEEAWALALQIQKDVKTQFGIKIEPEVNII
ncbi:UDP-N-acetylmuramate dehydrogenase [Flammeovirga aprica]|uniref:UDP-N-acetylenolpyruvoylglucosamine reductase n=1 Tax=Flammeovirga aprica JL-4 TaxID=694437 RepID=A0A7X9RYK1_9BACT|nr:UDP-N-acetylmuramate dehydrogenase [Flammeovirga aprica]NME71162.1 UDP-N-acetylmuramate dehydrogenase [Flammeovirga aprica JL-4]